MKGVGAMFGRSSKTDGPSGFEDGGGASKSESYLKLADSAQESGDESLAAHLYLAAFEAAQDSGDEADGVYVEGLRHAWHTACKRKERSLAEYIYEKLEPFSSEDELKVRTEQLQDMTLEKLEEFGFSHDEVQGMAAMLSDEVMNLGGGAELAATFMPPHLPVRTDADDKKEDDDAAVGADAADEAEAPAESADGQDAEAEEGPAEPAADDPAEEAHGSDAHTATWRVTFDDLVGYDRAIQAMRERGIGMADDEGFQQLVGELNERHGLDRMPYSRTILLQSAARDDANQFMIGIAGEAAAPAIRMYMDRNPQGFPVLCVMTSPDFKWRGHNLRAVFDGPGVLLLENLDAWSEPLEGMGDFETSYGQLTRGAREAVNFIRSCVENPDVLVVATCEDEAELPPFFRNMLEPLDVVAVDEPTREERAAVWRHVCELHPSIRAIDREMLVSCSANLSRSEIYGAGLAAVEDAYREGVRSRAYVPVSRQNIYEKLAAYQPVDSPEYAKLEDAAVAELRRSIEDWSEEDGRGDAPSEEEGER